jgi:hypothetical protein
MYVCWLQVIRMSAVVVFDFVIDPLSEHQELPRQGWTDR